MQTLPTTLSSALTILDTHLFLIDEMLPHWSIHPSGPLNTSAGCIFLNVVLFIFWRLETILIFFYYFSLVLSLLSRVKSAIITEVSRVAGYCNSGVKEDSSLSLGSYYYLFSIFFIESKVNTLMNYIYSLYLPRTRALEAVNK